MKKEKTEMREQDMDELLARGVLFLLKREGQDTKRLEALIEEKWPSKTLGQLEEK